MKALYINGLQAVIEVNQYFPFTYKLSDLEEINIINFPSTKSILLPRNLQNDELFGHIAEITRNNYGYEDNLIGISFNQFKRAGYELYNNSELISEGIIRIVGITDDAYEIELYDLAIELLETYDNTLLNELSLINPQTGLPLSVRINHSKLAEMATSDYRIKPVFGMYNSDYTGNQIYCTKVAEVNPTVVLTVGVQTLPVELTPLQMRTFSAADVPFTISLIDMYDMITSFTNGKIQISDTVRDLTQKVHMLLSKPVNSLSSTEQLLLSSTIVRANPGDPVKGDWLFAEQIPTKSDTGTDIIFFNTNYSIRNRFEFKFTTTGGQSDLYMTRYKGVTYDYTTTPDGAIIGELLVNSVPRLTYTDGRPDVILPKIVSKIILIKGVNTTYTKLGGNGVLLVEGTFIIGQDIHPKTVDGAKLIISHSFTNKFDAEITYIFSRNDEYDINIKLFPKLVLKPLKFTEYDLLTGQKILPKISIKDFIINIAKTYNLNISTKDGGLYIDVKSYRITDEILIMDNNIKMDVSKVNFSKLKITSGAPDSILIDEYEEEFGDWCSQIINTGFSIKKEEKEIELPYSTSLDVIDYDYFAYDQFGQYLNGGYNRNSHGDITGLEGLVLGYLETNEDLIFVTDSQIVEGNSIISNMKLFYIPLDLIPWQFRDTDVDLANISNINSYQTFLPYKFTDNKITESLEVNKPHYNFANITDSEYPRHSTLYSRFHKSKLEDKYNSNTHILTAKVFLNGVVDTGKIYNYKNSNYIISELIEYDPTEPNLYEVKLMRVNDVSNYTRIYPIEEFMYRNVFLLTPTATFSGDVRPYADKLLGFDVQIYISISDGAPILVLDQSTIPSFRYSYEADKTEMYSTFTYSEMFKSSETYAIWAECSIVYRNDGVNNFVTLNETDIISLDYLDLETSGIILNDSNAQTLQLISGPGGVSVDYLVTQIQFKNNILPN